MFTGEKAKKEAIEHFFFQETHSSTAEFQGKGSNLPSLPQFGHQVFRGLQPDTSCALGGSSKLSTESLAVRPMYQVYLVVVNILYP